MNLRQIEDEQNLLDFAMKMNNVLWEGPVTNGQIKMVEKFGENEAKNKSLVILFHGMKSAFNQMNKEYERALLGEA